VLLLLLLTLSLFVVFVLLLLLALALLVRVLVLLALVGLGGVDGARGVHLHRQAALVRLQLAHVDVALGASLDSGALGVLLGCPAGARQADRFLLIAGLLVAVAFLVAIALLVAVAFPLVAIALLVAVAFPLVFVGLLHRGLLVAAGGREQLLQEVGRQFRAVDLQDDDLGAAVFALVGLLRVGLLVAVGLLGGLLVGQRAAGRQEQAGNRDRQLSHDGLHFASLCRARIASP